MRLFDRRSVRTDTDTGEEQDPPVEMVIATAVRMMEQARLRRDVAIATAQGIPLRDLARAAGLSEARVKQLRAERDRPHGRTATMPPIPEFDLPAQDPPADRVMSLEQVAPGLPRFEKAGGESAENAYLASLPGSPEDWRTSDIVFHAYDDDPLERWVVSAAHRHYHRDGLTAHVYAFTAGGDLCHPLGVLPSIRVATEAIPARIADRLGGIAWVYGRIQLANGILRAAAHPFDELLVASDAFTEHLVATEDRGPYPRWL